jgi:predicted amidohydrolase
MVQEITGEITGRFTVACVQTNSARDIEPNIVIVGNLVREARRRGADLILLPENVGMLEPVSRLLCEKARPEAEHLALAAFRRLAQDTGAWLLIGSLAIAVEGGKVANRSLLVDPMGNIVARYDKIHLFDVDLGDGESYRESATIAPGDRAVLAATPWGSLGMTVCYDLRFPQLYRTLAQRGALFLSIPAAFTRTTGRAHWHILQRARAIENGAFVFAPAQCGTHAEGRETYGHSLIVDPWGEVLADGGEEPGIVLAEVDPEAVARARSRIPSLRHDHAFN